MQGRISLYFFYNFIHMCPPDLGLKEMYMKPTGLIYWMKPISIVPIVTHAYETHKI